MTHHRIIIAWLALALSCAAAIAQEQSPTDRWLDLAAQRVRAGQPEQAAAAYREVLRYDPINTLAYRQLLHIDAALGPTADPTQSARLAQEFPHDIFLLESKHYILIYDGFHTWADTRANMLEAAHDRFVKTMRNAGFRAAPLERRLEVILFNKHETYTQYAQKVDRMGDVWSAGHYSGRTNRIVLFNYHTSPQLATLLGDMQDAQQVADAAQHKRPAAERKLNEAKYRYEATASLANIKQTMHEASHQLAFNTNIQRRDVQYPMWYSEGLATNFETTNPFAPFGPQQDNPIRRASLVKAVQDRLLMPLADFVAMADPPADEQRRGAAYAQAWALWHFAFNTSLPALRTYTVNMLQEQPGHRSPQQMQADFVKAFGPIEIIEPAFRDYVQQSIGQ